MKQFLKKKNLFLAHYMMPNILIQGNEGIAKFLLMLESPLEQSCGV
jgi:hypothetical protein